MPTLTYLDSVVPGDRTAFHDVNTFARDTGWLHTPMLDYATYGVVLFAGLLLVGWWVARSTGDLHTVAAALWAPLGALLALAVNQPLVGAFQEARPYTVLPHMLLLAHRSSDYSFPSDHAVMAGSVATGLFLVSRRLGIVTLVAALLMAFARVYVGAHWPGDVVAGLLVGAVIAGGGFKLVERPAVAIVAFLARTPLRPLLVSGSTPDTGAATRDESGSPTTRPGGEPTATGR